MRREMVLVAHWEGPYDFDEAVRKQSKNNALVLYACFGSHHLYGRDVLLYLGKAKNGVGKRLPSHKAWIQYEYDRVSVRLASLGAFKSWHDWELGEHYRKAQDATLRKAEALLIVSHQPAYNSQSKGRAALAKGLRLFNTGRLGNLLPEVSFLYQVGDS
jgi:hypothetical protein